VGSSNDVNVTISPHKMHQNAHDLSILTDKAACLQNNKNQATFSPPLTSKIYSFFTPLTTGYAPEVMHA